MRWEQIEFLLKGVYLGLLLLLALQGPSWEQLGTVGAIAAGIFALCLAYSAIIKLREGYRPRNRWAMYAVFLILETPRTVYLGVIAGLLIGIYYVFQDRITEWPELVPLGIGTVIGVFFYVLRQIQLKGIRVWLGIGLTVVLVGSAIAYLHFRDLPSTVSQEMAAYVMLLGIPGFYLLTFASIAEESEIEFAAICSALGIGMWVLAGVQEVSPTTKGLTLVIAVLLYFTYTRRIMPNLRIGKHVLRGLSYAQVGHYRLALLALGRAVELDPDNKLASDKLWQVHREIDFNQLVNDPETLAVVNFELCLDRVAWLLLLDKPTPAQIEEAHQLLDMVSSHRPELLPRCKYWRAVALLHQREYEKAAEELDDVLVAPAQDTEQRRKILFPAWQLAITLHPEMKKRVGAVLLEEPSRRLEAIAAVERKLRSSEQDQAAWDVKRLLYSDLTERDYFAAVEEPQRDFGYQYVQQLGMALVDDKENWERGTDYLRIAAHGLTSEAPTIFLHIAKAHQNAGDKEGMWRNIERAKQAAREIGVTTIAEEERNALFAAVKLLGEHYINADDVDDALDCFKFYSQFDRAGIETYRTLANLFERRYQEAGDAANPDDIWMALNCAEHGLSYDSKDQDMQNRKDRYYYSITPEQLRQRLDNVYKWFDADYCKQKARYVVERAQTDLDLIDWANHLIQLAAVIYPESLAVASLRGRIARLRGEMEEAIQIFEKIRANKPERFASRDDEDAWYLTHRMLGELYIDEKPHEAIKCLSEYRKSPKSGATTSYNLGRAYENIGDFANAIRCYEQVTAFEGNPLVYDAQQALDRLRSKAQS